MQFVENPNDQIVSAHINPNQTAKGGGGGGGMGGRGHKVLISAIKNFLDIHGIATRSGYFAQN